jgi:hypothetical protein
MYYTRGLSSRAGLGRHDGVLGIVIQFTGYIYLFLAIKKKLYGITDSSKLKLLIISFRFTEVFSVLGITIRSLI